MMEMIAKVRRVETRANNKVLWVLLMVTSLLLHYWIRESRQHSWFLRRKGTQQKMVNSKLYKSHSDSDSNGEKKRMAKAKNKNGVNKKK
jgi:hypothetical protein